MDHECNEECTTMDAERAIAEVASSIKIAIYRCISDCGLMTIHKMVVMGLVAQSLVHSYTITEYYNNRGNNTFEFFLDQVLETMKSNIMEDFKSYREKMN